MWIMTSFGILMPSIIPPKYQKPGDDRTLQIRTRREKDLTILRTKYMPRTLGPSIYSPDKDYEWRAYCTPEAFGLAMAQMITEIDYAKFKPTTEDQYHDRELHDTYNAIWSVVSRHLSTKTHQTAYWHRIRPHTPSKSGKGTVTTVGDLVGSGHYEPSYRGNGEPLDRWRHWDEEYRHYDTGVGRDAYEAEVWDQPDVVESLYDEIDELLREHPIDHSRCAHPASDNARARCRRRRRRANENRVEALRAEIEDHRADQLALPAS